MPVNPFEAITLELYEREYAARHLLHGVIDHWTGVKPDAPVIRNAT